jgi:beta-xylosidase
MNDPRSRALLLTLIILIAAPAGGNWNADPAASSIYLFASFRGNGDGLHLAWSTDGLKWTALADDRILLQPTVGEKLMRDPCILRGPDGVFRMVWTSGWYERVIGYASSKDLIHWSEQKAIPVMAHEPSARNCWAPEIAYDSAKRQYLIFWATTIPGRFPETDAFGDNGLNHRMYGTTTKDFETFAPAKLVFDPGYSVIDATMVPAHGRYHLVFKEETLKPVKKHLRVASGDSMEGPFEEISQPFTPSWVEGPSVLKIADRYIVYYDMYTARKYGAMQSGDLKKWEDISTQLSLPAGTKHGTAFAVSRDILTALLALSGSEAAPTKVDAQAGKAAAKPLFRDPVYDGAADPVVVWNRAEKRWFMFYTNRRANLPAAEAQGVSWVHGTRIGIAQSSDGGVTWSYRGTADIRYGEGELTHWAPEVLDDGNTYHMFLTLVPGIFTDWNHPRDIIHLTSADLLAWKYESTLKLSSDRVIDACVYHLPGGTWRLWYNNERDGKSIYYADSRNLAAWSDLGKVVGVGERPGEGPKVFRWKGYYWMVVDIWKGLGVYRSEDAVHWTAQNSNLLETPGKGPDDEVKGGHPDVVLSGDRAFLFYFTHPGRRGSDAKKDGYEQRRSSIQVAELEYNNGWLSCDRDRPAYILLQPPK